MYFGTKSYLKSNHYHTPKHPLNSRLAAVWIPLLKTTPHVFLGPACATTPTSTRDVFSIFIFFFELSPFFNFLPRSKTLMGTLPDMKRKILQANHLPLQCLFGHHRRGKESAYFAKS
jgi:hypothetical protein